MAAKKRKKRTALIIAVAAAIAIFLSAIAQLEKPVFEQDSIDSPDSEKPDITKARILEGNSGVGVLLIHGFGATAFETAALAEYLNTRNITTYRVLLAGHGTSIYDFERAKADDWYRSVEEAYDSIDEPKRIVIGVSLGGLLALELASKREAGGVVLVSTPIMFRDKRIAWTPLLRYFNRYTHREIEQEHRSYYHENFPVRSIAEMLRYLRMVKMLIPMVQEPALVVQSRNDPRVDYRSGQYIYENMGSEKKELIWLNSDKHIPLIEYLNESNEERAEREELFEVIYGFVVSEASTVLS